MTKSQIRLAWRKVIRETHKIPDWDSLKRNSKQYRKVVILRELILYCQVLLGNMETGENVAFNTVIFKKTFDFYCSQIRKYV